MVRVCSALEFGEELSFCAVRAIWALAGINGFGAACEKRRAVKRWLDRTCWGDYTIRARRFVPALVIG
jgi:hypothetical protein